MRSCFLCARARAWVVCFAALLTPPFATHAHAHARTHRTRSSERISRSGAQGDRLKEAQAINTSLSALGDVISARAQKQKHVPFRNSTLTWLLSDSLSSDSKTLMFVNLSPMASNADESICSLNFATRVRTVELGKATKHVAAAGGGGGGGAESDGPG